MSNPNRSGWVKTNNQSFKEELARKRKERETRAKQGTPRCDYCILGDHDNCYRVVCHCNCDEERVKERLDERNGRLGI